MLQVLGKPTSINVRKRLLSLPIIRLARNQSLALRLERGTQLVAVQGSIRLTTAPRWLADSVWRAKLVMRAGDAHAVSAPGWIELQAEDEPAELQCMAMPAATPHGITNHGARALLTFVRRTFI